MPIVIIFAAVVGLDDFPGKAWREAVTISWLYCGASSASPQVPYSGENGCGQTNSTSLSVLKFGVLSLPFPANTF